MNESFDKDFSNHTPMMQQYHALLINTLKNKYKFLLMLLTAY